MACETMLEDLTSYVHGELGTREKGSVEAHLRGCIGCHSEVGRLKKLEDLLRIYLPGISPSPTYASTFANRLAAEIAAEEARRERAGLFGWLARPWLIPAGALAVLVLAVAYSPSLGPSAPVVAKRPAEPPSAEVAVAPKRAPQPRPESKPEPPVSVADAEPAVPPELISEADPFLDYAVIRQLRILETSPGKAG